MRSGNWNARNVQLYNECHFNPYYQKFLELKKQHEEDIHKTTTSTGDTPCKHTEQAVETLTEGQYVVQ